MTGFARFGGYVVVYVCGATGKILPRVGTAQMMMLLARTMNGAVGYVSAVLLRNANEKHLISHRKFVIRIAHHRVLVCVLLPF